MSTTTSVPSFVTNSLFGAALAAATSSMYLGRPGMEAGVAALATVGGEYVATKIKAGSGVTYNVENALAQGGLVFLADFFLFAHGDVVAGAIAGLSAVLGNYLAKNVIVNGQTLNSELASKL